MKNKIFPLVLSLAFVFSACSSESETLAETESSVQTVSKTESETSSETVSSESESFQTTLQEPAYTNVCDEKIISEYKDEILPCANVKTLITYETFMNMAKENLAMMAEKETYAIHGLDEVYISTCGVSCYSLNRNEVTSEIQCFIFDSSLEQVGVLYFNKGFDGEYDSSWSICDSSIKPDGGKSVLLQALSENKDKKYVLLSYGLQGLGSAILDEDSNIVHLGAASSESDLEIIGNPYGIFEEKGLGVSYNDIVDEENLIKFEIKELG